MPHNPSALVQPLPSRALVDFERRSCIRRVVALEALSRPLESQDTIWWGATVRDVSSKGIGLSLCYPFRPGTYLAIDLQISGLSNRTLLSRVVQARDQVDGTWHIGCEFIKPLSDSDLELMN